MGDEVAQHFAGLDSLGQDSSLSQKLLQDAEHLGAINSHMISVAETGSQDYARLYPSTRFTLVQPH